MKTKFDENINEYLTIYEGKYFNTGRAEWC